MRTSFFNPFTITYYRSFSQIQKNVFKNFNWAFVSFFRKKIFQKAKISSSNLTNFLFSSIEVPEVLGSNIINNKLFYWVSWLIFVYFFKNTKIKIQILQCPFEEAEKRFEEWWNYRRGYHSTQMEESVQR